MLRKGQEEVHAEYEIPDTRVADAESLYQALSRRGLLRESNSGVFGHLVRAGELGLCSDNGSPYFLAPGRHILWSPLNAYKGNVKITDKNIKLNNIEIVTIDKSEIGLSLLKGEHILLEPGQHILVSPHAFLKSERVNKDYVNLGTHHRISIPVGSVAVAYNEGKKIIITPAPLKVDDAHSDYIICTDGKMFKTQSQTFIFNPDNGFKSIQMEDIQLEPLTVNTSEMIALKVEGSVRYQIVDPVKAFLITDDVVSDIKQQALATLTSVFSQLSIDEIATSLASTNITHTKHKGETIPHDMLHHATDIFMREFQEIVRLWGVDAKLVNITRLELVNQTFRDVVQSRAQKSMEANTNLAVVATQTDVQLQEARREKDKRIIEANAQSEAMHIKADAELYAATKRTEAAKHLETQPLAIQLSLLDGQERVAKALGDKTVITDFKLGNYGLSGVKGQMLWLKEPSAITSDSHEEEKQIALTH